MEVATDITYDRTKVLDTIAENYGVFSNAMGPYAERLQAYLESGGRKPRVRLPMFLTFIRQPFCVSFRINGHPGTAPYEIMAINAHLYFGQYITDRRQEFEALMEWIIGRAEMNHRAYYPNFLLHGGPEPGLRQPENDRGRIEEATSRPSTTGPAMPLMSTSRSSTRTRRSLSRSGPTRG